MSRMLKSVVLPLGLICGLSSTAQAARVSVDTTLDAGDSYAIAQSDAQWLYSTALQQALALGVSSAALPPATAGATSWASTLDRFTYDDQNLGIVSMALQGGLTLTAPTIGASGGTISFSEITVDLASATVRADIHYDQTTLTQAALFSASSVTVSPLSFDGSSPSFQATAAGLVFTSEALAAMQQAFNLINLNVALVIPPTLSLGDLAITASVPEPSSWALAALGLLAAATIAKRRTPARASV